MLQPVDEFMRFSAADPTALARSIAEARIKLSSALQVGEALAVVDAAADLGSLLTTARKEIEAAELLEQHRLRAE